MPRSRKSRASPRLRVAAVVPRNRWEARRTSRKYSGWFLLRSALPAVPPSSSQARFSSSHISVVIWSRIIRAFSRARSRQAAMELGLSAPKLRKEITSPAVGLSLFPEKDSTAPLACRIPCQSTRRLPARSSSAWR